MKKIQTICCVFLLCSGGIIAQDPATAALPQEPPVRVPGRPDSPEELAAFNQLAALQTRGERIRQGQAFLSTYANSGLSSYVHHMLASAYGIEDPQKCVEHGEIGLRELPNSPSLLATLAFIYAETGNTALGAERGQVALQLIQGMEKPSQLTESNWLLQRLEIGGQANYAIGRHLLGQAETESPGRLEKLDEASQYLRRAMEQLVDDPYSAFRLGESYLRMGQLDKALTYFARTVVLGGSVGEIAKTRLLELYQSVHSSMEGMDELLAQQSAALEKAREARKAMLNVFSDRQKPGTESGTPPPGSRMKLNRSSQNS